LASSSERLKQSALADPGLLLTRSGAAQLSASAAIKGLKPATELFGKLHIGAARLATIQAMFDNELRLAGNNCRATGKSRELL
jgi:hypothetical protein